MPALEGTSFDHVLLTTRAVHKRLDLHRAVEMEVLRECFELAQLVRIAVSLFLWLKENI